MKLEAFIIEPITVGMAIAFLLGNVVLFSWMWKMERDEKSGYTTKRFLRPTAPNISFHFLSGLLVLLVLHEISDVVIERFFPELDSENQTYNMTLSGLTGMFGSVLVGYFLEKWAKKRNVADPNIKHVHDDDCDH